jgi:MoaA/NifB/PqqE/SkfB family radical SAM enzyme
MALEWIAFHVTDRCQLDCEHCLRDPEQKPKDISVDLVRKVLVEAKELYGAFHASFTGGEPTLHPEFMRLVDVVVDLGYRWHFVTNGRHFASVAQQLDARPARREGLTNVNFSLDGASEAVHDSIRGKGSYREVMRAVSVCTALGMGFTFNTALHARNVQEIEAIGLLAAQLGAKRASFGMIQPTSTHHDASLYLSAPAWRTVMDRIDRLKNLVTVPISSPEGFPKKGLFHVCTAFAQEQIHIDVLGRLNLCCQHSGVPNENGGPTRDIVADLNEVSLSEAHAGLVALIHETQNAKLVSIRKKELTSDWDQFPCNHCLKSFGKPHWTEDGVSGPKAKRERWTGAWAKKNQLPIVQ